MYVLSTSVSVVSREAEQITGVGFGFVGSVLEHNPLLADPEVDKKNTIRRTEEQVGEMLHISKIETESVTGQPLSHPPSTATADGRGLARFELPADCPVFAKSVPLHFPTSCLCL